MPVSRYLIDESPLTLRPGLAVLVGLNEAVFLQQVQYWIANYEADPNPIERKHHFHDGHCWIYNTYEQWRKQFPFWSTATLKRIILSLESKGILVSGNYNRLSLDQTKWYRIDHDALDRLGVAPSPLGQSDPMDRVNLTQPSGQYDPTNTRDYDRDYPESTNTAKQSTAGPLESKPPPKDKPIIVTREWQAKAQEIERRLQAKPQQRTVILKLCKEKPRPVIDAALTFAIDYPNARDKTMIFIKRVHALA